MGLCGLMACEKTINIQPDQQTSKLVVEAQIESGQAPVVALSTSLNYFSAIDPVALNNSYVHNAKVTISDGPKQVQMQAIMVTQSGNNKC